MTKKFLNRLSSQCLLLCAVLLMSFNSAAEECDDFIRDPSNKLPDSTVAINKLINKTFAEFEAMANASKLSCNREQLVDNILYFFDRNFSAVGNDLRDKAMSADGITYSDFGKPVRKIGGFTVGEEAPAPQPKILNVYNTTGVYCCAETVNVNGHVVGIDKIDHFFGNGGLLWKEYEEGTSKDEELVMKLNTIQEDGGWGLASAGVKSYGDLAANWDGFKFYKEIIDGPDPFVSCKDGQVKILKEFDLKKYVKISWRESANCSAFSTAEVATAFANNLKKMNMSCPQEPDDCEKIKALYKGNPKLVTSLVSPVCLRKIKMEESIEQPSPIRWGQIKAAIGGLRLKDVKAVIKKGQQ